MRRPPEHEALEVPRVRLVEHPLTSGDDVGGASVVHVDGMHQREADVVVLVMVTQRYAHLVPQMARDAVLVLDRPHDVPPEPPAGLAAA